MCEGLQKMAHLGVFDRLISALERAKKPLVAQCVK
jgi:hypothetical protein